ncbi:hypothetical protein [Polyangium spumosum]|uniref:Uncharacterized protein n=1 Tax=Polyangium spumosum TaxID=889282 RepID=A0A6N7PX39_9BACT|nr:hypothetical protein [Polyangium spumosum]MRG96563.1 hypothetical protein [Polyangium spumosum]
MWTEARIVIINDRIPGGPQTILGPAGCGPDVAVLDEVADATVITLDDTDERLALLQSLLEERGLRCSVRRNDRFTDEELEAARLLVMEYDTNATVFAGPMMGTTYDMSDACNRCGAGARQTSALFIDGEMLPRLEGRRAATTSHEEPLVDEKLAAALALSGATGLSFRDVFAAFEERGFRIPWRQVCATHPLPPMSPRSTGIEHYEPCPCGRSCFTGKEEVPLRLAYRASDLADIRDVNVTWEWYGISKYTGDLSESVLPYPLFLVTPKVRRIFLDAGITGFDWLPIRVVDE